MRFYKSVIQVQYPLKQFFRNLFWKKSDHNIKKFDIVEPWQVSKTRKVPSYIPKPDYAETSVPQTSPQRPEIKNNYEIESMRSSCTLAKEVLNHVKQSVKVGVTTDELDALVHEMIINNGAYPSPLNYRGFPKSICTSVNNVACHGIPDNRPLQKGDTLNVDITVYLNGFHGDCSAMFEVGECDKEIKRLINVTEICLKKAIEICKPNEDFCNIGNVIEEIASKHGYAIIPVFAGHGIGTYFHGPPDIFHIANDYAGKMQPGMTFTIEPVLSQGSSEVEILEDGWTAVTVDNACTAQIEHTILITDTGCDILTK